jgi:hypothetical protein
MLHKQCKFITKLNETLVAWIDSKYAKVNLNIRFKDSDKWWKVKEVYHAHVINDETLIKEQDKHRHQRKASDI